MFHQKALAVGRRWTNNWIEREEIRVITDDYTRLKNLVIIKENEIKRLKDLSMIRWEKVLEYIYKRYNEGSVSHPDNFCYIFNSIANLKVGDLVGYSLNDKRIYIYTEKTFYCGKVLENLNFGFYLVFYDRTFAHELKDVYRSGTNYDSVYYSYNEKRFVFAADRESFEKKKIIKARKHGNQYIPENINFLEADFKKQYLNQLPEYFANSQIKEEISRN